MHGTPVYAIPEIRAQEMMYKHYYPNKRAHTSYSYSNSRHRNKKEMSENCLIVTKKEFSNSPNVNHQTKLGPYVNSKNKAGSPEISKDKIMANHDLVLYAQQIPDSKRFTRINLEWLGQNHLNDERFKLYYSSILNHAGHPSKQRFEVKDLIPYPEKEIRISMDEETNEKMKEIKMFNDNVDYGAQLQKSISATKSSPKIAFSNIYNTNKYKYIVTPGNNSKLIKEAMKRRPWWVEIPNVDSVFNFKWQPVSYRMKFRELSSKSSFKQIVNHFEYHR